MFVGHYGVSFAARKSGPVPLWVLFVAVQLLDVGWSVLVLLGIEKVRIVPGITASNPLDLYYMPYTHSLVAALLWFEVLGLLYLGLGLTGLLVAGFVTPAVAASEYYVAQDTTSHKCSVVSKKPDGTKEIMLGTDGFKSKSEAHSAMKNMTECKA